MAMSNANADKLWKHWGPVALAALTASMIWTTFSNAIQVADSGELVAVACNGGVAHPPGYPLYSLLGRAFCAVPVTTPAGRLSLLSALAAIGSALLLFSIARRLTASTVASALAATCLVTGALFWRYASLPEVFALHVALNLALVRVALWTADAGAPREHAVRSLLCAVVGGLALANHHSSVFVAPLAAVVVLRPTRGLDALPRRLGLVLLGLALGLAPYLYLLVVDGQPRWGELDGLGDLIDHFLRTDYGTFALSIEGTGTPGDVLAAFLADLPAQLGGPLVVFAAVGVGALALAVGKRRVVGLARLRRDVAAALIAIPLLAGPAFFALFNLGAQGISRQVVERFFLMPIALLAIWLGIGVAIAFARLARVRPGLRMAAVAACATAVLAMAVRNHELADVSESYAAEDYGLDVLASAEPGALVLGEGDVHLFSVLYAQSVLGVRRDVQYVDVWLLIYPWYVEQQRRADARFVYEHHPRRSAWPKVIQAAFEQGRPVYIASEFTAAVGRMPSYPVGPLRRLVPPRTKPPHPDDVLALNKRLAATYGRRGARPDPEHDAWSASLRVSYASNLLALAGVLQRAGNLEGADWARRQAADWAPWLAP